MTPCILGYLGFHSELQGGGVGEWISGMMVAICTEAVRDMS